MDLNESDIVECKFCGGYLKPVWDRKAPRGLKFFRCDDCGTSNVLADQPEKSAVSP